MRSRRVRISGLAALLLALGLGDATERVLADTAEVCRTQAIEMLELDLEGYVPFAGEGTVTLCERSHAITATVVLEGLERLNAYSAWWIYRSDPMECSNPDTFDWSWSCEGALWEPGQQDGEIPVIGRIGSSIANLGGKARWRDTLRGFNPPPNSAMIILVMHHGEAQFQDRLRLARQRLTPERWMWGMPGLGNFFDYYTPPWVFEMGWTQFVFE